jgi:hypothetical protein
MFLTITIDTKQKKRSKIRMKKTRIDPKKGWHRILKMKKMGFWDKFIHFNKKAKSGAYRLGDQTIMF